MRSNIHLPVQRRCSLMTSTTTGFVLLIVACLAWQCVAEFPLYCRYGSPVVAYPSPELQNKVSAIALILSFFMSTYVRQTFHWLVLNLLTLPPCFTVNSPCMALSIRLLYLIQYDYVMVSTMIRHGDRTPSNSNGTSLSSSPSSLWRHFPYASVLISLDAIILLF